MESRMSRLEGAYEQVDRRLDSVDHRLDSVDRRLDSVDRRLDSMDHRFESLQHEMYEGFRLLDGKIDQRFMWTMGGIATSWATTMLAIVFHH